MRSKCVMGIGFILLSASLAAADVTVTYAPTQLPPGVATNITISISTDEPFGVGGVFFVFEADAGLNLTAFRWLNGLDGEKYIFTMAFPNPQTSWLDVNPGGLPIGEDPVAIALVTVRADEELAGGTATLAAFADDPFALIVADTSPGALPIAAGRSDELSIQGSGGGDPPGSIGEEPPDPGEGEGNQGSEPGAGDPGEEGEGDPSRPGGDENTVAPDVGGEAPASEGTETGGGGESGAEDAGNAPGQVGGAADGESGNGGQGSPPIAGPCGLGMIGFAFFTLTALSGMKLLRDKRRPVV